MRASLGATQTSRDHYPMPNVRSASRGTDKQVARIFISNLSEREPTGRTTVGYYVLQDGLLTMTQ